jgi:hypothetical protein
VWAEVPLDGAFAGLQEQIAAFVRNLRDGRAVADRRG